MPYLICKNRICGWPVWAAIVFLVAVAGCANPAADNSNSKTAFLSGAGATPLLQADEALHRRLQAVLDADSAYNQLLDGTVAPAALDEKTGQVIQAEMALQQTIDSLEEEATGAAGYQDQLVHLTGYFRKALQSRQTLSDLRMVLSADSEDSTAVQQTVAQLRSELLEKNRRIAALEQANKTATEQARQGTPRNAAPTEPATYAPAKGETSSDLQQRNKNLALALSTLQTKYFVLGRDYLVLKQQHERTVAELAALRKTQK